MPSHTRLCYICLKFKRLPLRSSILGVSAVRLIQIRSTVSHKYLCLSRKFRMAADLRGVRGIACPPPRRDPSCRTPAQEIIYNDQDVNRPSSHRDRIRPVTWNENVKFCHGLKYSYDIHIKPLLWILSGVIDSSYALIYSQTGGTRNHS
jgi:hypothetical protein